MYNDCQVVTEYEPDKIHFKGNYQDCKSWINEHYSEYFNIQSCITGRFLTMVWSSLNK